MKIQMIAVLLLGVLLVQCKTQKPKAPTDVVVSPEVPEAPDPPMVEEIVKEVIPDSPDVEAVEDVIVNEPPIAQDMAIMTLEQYIYYTIETNDKDEEVYRENIVEGEATYGKNSKDETTAEIIVSGTDQVINCVERIHPDLNKMVLVEIGGESEVRER